jgi:hypothetical protein
MEFGPCFVAYFDILGWSELMRSKRGDEVANKIVGALFHVYTARQLVKQDQELVALGAVTDDFGKTLTASFFSDSFLYSCAAESDEAAWLTDRVRQICQTLFWDGLYTRGAIVVGDLHHEADRTMIGRALVDAHEIERDVAKYPRLVVTDEARALLASAGERAQQLGPFLRTDADGLSYLDIFADMTREDLVAARQRVDEDIIQAKGSDASSNPVRALSRRAKYGWVRSCIEQALSEKATPST